MSKISTSISNDFCPQTLFVYGKEKMNIPLQVEKGTVLDVPVLAEFL